MRRKACLKISPFRSPGSSGYALLSLYAEDIIKGLQNVLFAPLYRKRDRTLRPVNPSSGYVRYLKAGIRENEPYRVYLGYDPRVHQRHHADTVSGGITESPLPAAPACLDHRRNKFFKPDRDYETASPRVKYPHGRAYRASGVARHQNPGAPISINGIRAFYVNVVM